jgi:FMN phosphatase YigB (HAD superfamily)
VGETLVDETSSWNAWADHLGVDRGEFHAALGDVVEAGLDHRAVFARVAPGVEVHAGDVAWRLTPDDLYPDAVPVLAALDEAGIAVGIVGNQPAATEIFLRELPVGAAMIGSSARWGVTKPDPAFFSRVVAEMRRPADRIAYVGDRLDNDVLPAFDAGMAAILVVRGPWGTRHAIRPEAARATAVVTDLMKIVDAVGANRPL